MLSGTAAGDVIVLKTGQKIRGKVVEKGLVYEVTTDAGLRTFGVEEVEDVLSDPKDLLGDAETVFESAKADYQKALDLASAAEQQAAFRAAVEKVTRLREAYAEAVELFPENDATAKKLVQVMQLLRLCRERLGSELARPTPLAPGAAPSIPLPSLSESLADPAKRGDPAWRAGAATAFLALGRSVPSVHDLAVAASLYLSKTDVEWKLSDPVRKALDEYFGKFWGKDLAATAHIDAARFIAERIAAIRKVDTRVDAEPLVLFAMGHLGCASVGPERDKAGATLGLVASGSALGTSEGLATRDLSGLIGEGQFRLAVLCLDREHRGISAPAPRLLYGYALACLAQRQRGGFERAASALQSGLASAVAAVRDHAAALAKSLRDAAVCAGCAGEGKLRCTNCQGVKEVKIACQKCGGKGRLIPPGLQATRPKQLRKVGAQCPPCKGTGVEKTFRCEKCKDGSVDCKKCEAPKPPPEIEDLFASTPCARCEGKGQPFRNVAWPCPGCLGLGRRLVPKADPSKVLP